MSELSKMTPWEFACQWYRPEEIHQSVNKTGLVPDCTAIEPIPKDVFSREFAEWLCKQYRLAMTKGIQLQRGEDRDRIAEQGEVERLRSRVVELEQGVARLAIEVGKQSRATGVMFDVGLYEHVDVFDRSDNE